MKKCFKCNIDKPLSDYYKHKHMLDGHLNKCKECTRKDVNKRLEILRSDDDWVYKERERGREKYHRLNYYEKYAQNRKGSRKMKATRKFREEYPEKYKAYIKTNRMKRESGSVLHHWSYRDEHHTDVIPLPHHVHYDLHRSISYDKYHKMFRDKNGILLSSKDMHINFITQTTGFKL